MDRATDPDTAVRRILLIATLFASGLPVVAQNAEVLNDELNKKVAAVKASAAENKEKLRHYQWTETTQLTLNEDTQSATHSLCQYAPDGQLKVTPIDPVPGPPHSAGKVGQAVIVKKPKGGKDYTSRVQSLVNMYMPPDAQRMEDALKAGNVSVSTNAGSGEAELVFRDYARSGDEMALAFERDARTIRSVNVKTYWDDPKDTVRLAARMASLPDGTRYAQQTVLEATGKKLRVTTTSSNYQPK